MEELHAIVSGRVQRVMYRDFVKRGARALGVRGWVRNLPDGTVEVCAQGTGEQIDQLIARMRTGSLLSHVADMKIGRTQASHEYGRFAIIA